MDAWRDEKATPSVGLENESVLSLAEDKAGNIWIGTYSTGLLRWADGAIQERFTSADLLPSNQVRAVLEGRDGTLWAGTARGLMRRKDGVATSLGEKDGLPRDFVLSLLEASDGSLWVGTSNGAGHVQGDKITALDLGKLDGAQDVFGMHEASNWPIEFPGSAYCR